VRIEYGGAFYHVMARGNRREAIFLDNDDRRFFLQALSEVCEKTGWRVHAWVLMGNHYHLFIETPEANLVEGMKWLQNTVTRRFNIRHRQWGRLFGDRYTAVIVEGELPAYYETLMNYIHLNPGRAGLVNVEKGESILDYPWSSVAGGYALPPGKRAKWLAAEMGMRVLGFADTAAGRRELVSYLDRRILEEGERSGEVTLAGEVDRRMIDLKRGWYWGRQEFAEKMLKLGQNLISKGKSREYRRSPQKLEQGEREAERLVKEGLQTAELPESKLAELKGSDPRKVALGMLIWKTTTVSQEWIARRLQMKSAANVSQLLSRTRSGKNNEKLPLALCEFIANESS
jgi:REP element-mobilizing transposase RayT